MAEAPDALREVKVKLTAGTIVRLQFVKITQRTTFSQAIQDALDAYFDRIVDEPERTGSVPWHQAAAEVASQGTHVPAGERGPPSHADPVHGAGARGPAGAWGTGPAADPPAAGHGPRTSAW